MNYIDNKTFIDNELIPTITEIVYSYIDEEISYIETIDDLEEFEYANCPEELRANIFEKVSNLITECIDDYDIITNVENEEYEDKINEIIDEVFEEVKTTKADICRDNFEKFDYLNDEDFFY